MPRVSLYLPRHLHQRLDELPDDVSLSAIFQDGLEHALAQLDPNEQEASHAD